ncbi:ATP-dependent DNA helicase MER3 [Clonorchis sinensis]|uniref:ATP-dependent DNA helicase MER3 n=1 Tax=Clonorchis sinensis TaxID=79923 RepID=A0A8T1MT18_CLOSI|nr:ATP-dependent DNA helicase MER3 [Clonorchis sinensis]
MKIICLLQAKLGGVPLADFSLENETRRICRCAKRIVNGLAGLLWLDLDDSDSPEEQPSTVKLDTDAPVPAASSAFKCMINILEFKKTLQFLTWMNQPLASLLNLQQLGTADIEKLMLAGLMTLHSIENTSTSELERILEKHPPFGEQLVDSVRLIPKYILEVEQTPSSDPTTLVIQLCLRSSRPSASDTVIVLVGDSNNKIICKHRLKSTELIDDGYRDVISIPSKETGQRLSFSVISTNFAGIDLHTSFTPISTIPTLKSRLPSCQTHSKTCAAGAFPDISVGYVEDGEFYACQRDVCDAEEKASIQWPEATSTQVPRAPSISLPFRVGFPQSPISGIEPVSSTRFHKSTQQAGAPATGRQTTKPQNGTKTPKMKSTFTWTPTTKHSTPKIALIQTSMLDYIRSHQGHSKVITKPLSEMIRPRSPLINIPTPAVPKSITTVAKSDPIYRKFRWSPLNEINQHQNNGQIKEKTLDQQDISTGHNPLKLPQETPHNPKCMTEDPKYINQDSSTDYFAKEPATIDEDCGPSVSDLDNDRLSWSPVSIVEMVVEDGYNQQKENSFENLDQYPVELALSPKQPVTGDDCLRISNQSREATEMDTIEHASMTESTVIPTVPLVERLPESISFQGQYIMGDGSATVKHIHAPISFPEFSRNGENRPCFSMTPRENLECTKKASNPLLPSSATREVITTSQKQNVTPTIPQPFQFKAPTDIRFEKLLHKWRRLNNQEEPRSKPTFNVDMDLINEGWEELACWIRVTEICSQYNMEDLLVQTGMQETPRTTDKNRQTKRALTGGLTEVIKTTTVQRLGAEETNTTHNTPGNSKRPPVDLDQYPKALAASEE